MQAILKVFNCQCHCHFDICVICQVETLTLETNVGCEIINSDVASKYRTAKKNGKVVVDISELFGAIFQIAQL